MAVSLTGYVLACAQTDRPKLHRTGARALHTLFAGKILYCCSDASTQTSIMVGTNQMQCNSGATCTWLCRQAARFTLDATTRRSAALLF